MTAQSDTCYTSVSRGIHGGMMAFSRPETGISPSEVRVLGLPEPDKQALAMVFGGIESMLFLGSNFGAMLERLAQLPPKEKRKGPEAKKYRDIDPEVMCVKSSHSIRVSDEPSKLESWACWTNHEIDSDGHRVEEARDALVWLVDHDQTWAVTVLHKLYGGVLPALESCQLSFLGELAPLALDTGTVLRHAAELTKRLRASMGADREASHTSEDGSLVMERWTPKPGKHQDRKETVTPRTALVELLVDWEHGHAIRNAIRTDAFELSVKAASAYMRAKSSC